MAFGNILFGDVIGAGVDIATGAAYDYPELIVVEMGPVVSQQPTLRKVQNRAGSSTFLPQSGGNARPLP